jgi:hypothetical protein
MNWNDISSLFLLSSIVLSAVASGFLKLYGDNNSTIALLLVDISFVVACMYANKYQWDNILPNYISIIKSI